MFEKLLECPLFIGIPGNKIEILFNGIQYQLRNYESEYLIAQAGDSVDHLVIVISGSVRGEMLDFSGRILKIEDIPAPQSIATAFIFGLRNFYPVNVITNVKSEILFIPKAQLLDMFSGNSVFLMNFLNMISSRAQFLTTKMRFLSFKTIKGKIAQYLMDLGADKAEALVLDKPQHQIADYFGVARPSFARALGEMQKEGIISLQRRRVEIIDRVKLKSLLQ